MPAPKDQMKCALWKERISKAAKLRYKNKTKHPFYGKHHTRRAKERIRKAVSENPRSFKEGYVPWNKGLTKEEDERVAKQIWNGGLTKETDERVRKNAQAVSKALKGKEGHPPWNKGLTKKTDEKVREYSKSLKNHWQDSEFREKMVKAISSAARTQPNKAELKLFGVLQRILPGEYEINVKAEVMILGGKIPDFVNINSQKKVIELYGQYWHRGDNPQDRINYFKRLGWNTLVVWEQELEDENLLVQKLREFNRI